MVPDRKLPPAIDGVLTVVGMKPPGLTYDHLASLYHGGERVSLAGLKYSAPDFAREAVTLTGQDPHSYANVLIMRADRLRTDFGFTPTGLSIRVQQRRDIVTRNNNDTGDVTKNIALGNLELSYSPLPLSDHSTLLKDSPEAPSVSWAVSQVRVREVPAWAHNETSTTTAAGEYADRLSRLEIIQDQDFFEYDLTWDGRLVAAWLRSRPSNPSQVDRDPPAQPTELNFELIQNILQIRLRVGQMKVDSQVPYILNVYSTAGKTL